jgi:AcrR family transcriptional regulator
MQQRRKNTRAKIINSTIELLKKKSLSTITVEDILKESHVSRATFYYSFKNTHDVLQQAEADVLRENAEYVSSLPQPCSSEKLHYYLMEFILDHFDFFYMTATSWQSNALFEMYNAGRDALKKLWREEQGITDEQTLEWLFEFTMSVVVGMTKFWMLQYGADKERFKDMMKFQRDAMTYVTHGLATQELGK